MAIKNILKAAVVSGAAIAAGVNVSAAHDRSPGAVENFMHSIKDPNVKKHGNSTLLYDGNKLVVYGGQCDQSAIRVFLNKKGSDLVAVFAAYTIQDTSRAVKHINPRGVAAHAMVDDATQTFSKSGNAVGANWYDANGPLPKSVDEMQLSLGQPQGCHGSNGASPSKNTPDPSTPSTPSGGCGSCNGNNGGKEGDTGNGNNGNNNGGGSNNNGGSTGGGPGGGNSPPGGGDAGYGDASAIIKKMQERMYGFVPSIA